MEKILRRVYFSPQLSFALKLISHIVTALMVFIFAHLALLAALNSVLVLLELLVVLGVPFVAVSVLRHVFDAPRPYEIYDFYDTPPKKKCGKSFPSRHAYSAFAIGTALYYMSPPLGGLSLLLAALMCTARVLLGIHFIRDVVTGAAVGTVSVLLGILIFVFI